MSEQGYKEALKRIAEVKQSGVDTLDLSSLSLEEIPKEILELDGLKKLYLNNNEITELGVLGGLSDVIELHLNNNQIKELGVLRELNGLRTLVLCNNQITELEALRELYSLRTLILCNNQIRILRALTNLNALRELNLSGNKIIELGALRKLSNLRVLELRNNQIIELTVLRGLSVLSLLELRMNNITELSDLIPFLEKNSLILENFKHFKNEFSVGQNPLQHPPMEIVREGNEAVLQYFKDLEEQGLGELNEVKLIIVGEPEAGKSSLMEMLRDPKFSLDPEAESTLGINVKPWSFNDPRDKEKSLTANIWDFGGQQIQYMTHQFFLTPDSVYVLVCANDRKEAVNFRYWFKIIHLLGEVEGRYSPVLVVKNYKNDEFNFNFDLSAYKKMYPELQIEELEVNLNERNTKYKVLEESIQDMLSKLPMVNDKRPAKWSVIRDELRELAKEHDHIDFKAYADICKKHGVNEEASQKLLSGYLHTIGNLLHFVDDMVLRDFIILNPQWAVDAVYAVLVDTDIGKNSGRFKQEKLDDIWAKYSIDERSKLLNLMRKDNFEICYKVNEEENVFVAPQLLDDIRPEYIWDNEKNLKFRFQYTFMPDGIITRLIVRLNARISEGLVWKKGVVLEDGETKAEVVEDEHKGLQVIDIKVSGAEEKQKYLLHTIREEIKGIHNRWFKNIDFEEMIPCNCKVCVESETPEYFKYSTLETRYQKKTKKTIECHKSEIDVDVLSLLEGVVRREELDAVQKREFKDELVPVVNVNVTNNIPAQEVETKIAETSVQESFKEEDIPWYKEWWFYGLVAGIITAIVIWFWLGSLSISTASGIFVGYLVYNMNPKRRYLRVVYLALGWLMFSASPPVALKLGWIEKTKDNDSWFLLDTGDPLNVVVSLGFIGLIAWFGWLDSKEK